MTRDELLTKLAMELTEWPKCGGNNGPFFFIPSSQYYGPDHPDKVVTTSGLTSSAWQQRRAELINEPDDADAPEWARWKAQDADGRWHWYEFEPHHSGGADYWYKHGPKHRHLFVAYGKIPAGHDWKTTLKEVNVKRELNPATSSITDNQAREMAEQLGFCRDGLLCGVPPYAGDDAYCAACPNAPHAQDARQLDEQLERDIKAFREVYKMAEDQDAAEFGLPNANSILNAAAQHMQDRAATYDKPQGERSMGATVEAFSAITGHELSEEQGWLFMQLLKAVRSQQGAYRADSYEDGAAYAALAGEAAARGRA